MTNQLPKLGFATETDHRLSVWYHKLSVEGSARLQRHFGFLGSLLQVQVDSHMLESLIVFWDPTVMVFRFGEQELTPTLEEYAGLLKLTISGDPVLPNFKPGKSRTADFLGMKRDVLERAVGGDFSRYPISFLLDRFMDPEGFYKHHFSCSLSEWADNRLWVLALCLVAHLLFPREDKKIDMTLIDVIIQVRNGRTFIPAIIAETLRTLTFCRHKGKGFFTASASLLQIWMVSHLFKCPRPVQHFMNVDIITPLSKLPPPVQGKTEWYRYLAQLQDFDIQWYLGLCSSSSVRIQTSELSFIPLIGLTGGTPYAPGRVLRQFNRIQYIPRTEDMSYFYFDHSTSTKDRYSKALNQWCSVQPDEDHTNHLAGTGPAYVEWMQEELGLQLIEPKRPRTEESIINDHVKRLRTALDQEEAIRTRVQQENDQLQVNLHDAHARINHLEEALEQEEAARTLERERHRAYVQKSQARLRQLEIDILTKAESRISALHERLQQEEGENNRLKTVLGRIRELTMEFPQGDFSSFQVGLDTARTYMWNVLQLLF